MSGRADDQPFDWQQAGLLLCIVLDLLVVVWINWR